MADVTGVITSRHLTLTAGAADSITFAEDLEAVSLTHRGTAPAEPIYYTIGGAGTDDPAVPTVAGDDTFVLLVGERQVIAPDSGEATRVRLISAGAVPYSVEVG